MNVLIVDDNKDNRMTIELLLEDIDAINIEEAVDGAEAISMCKNTYFDLIFMDIMMPKVDGMEATTSIKSFSPLSMIIALSALDDDNSIHTMLECGAEDYITKPIDSDLFMQRVRNYIAIIAMRAQPICATKTTSLFKDAVYPVYKTFTIDSEASLSFFWDYYLNTTDNKAENISDIVRLIYGIGLWFLKTRKIFTIVCEENESNLYLTQVLSSISEVVVRNILLKHSPNALFILNDGVLSFKLKKSLQASSNIVLSEEKTSANNAIMEFDKKILSKTHFNKITAIEYVEMTAIAFMDKIESLESLEEEIDISIVKFEDENTPENIQNISKLLLDYVQVIEQLVEFEHLSYAISTLAKFLENLDTSQFDEKKVKKFITLIICLMSDLSNWRDTLFIKQEANDIHYLDSSLLSSCLQLESIFEEEKISETDDEDELEFF